jgi:hypothetical protein
MNYKIRNIVKNFSILINRMMINIIMEFCNTKRELWEWQKNKNILKNNKKNN